MGQGIKCCIRLKKHSIGVATKKVHCHERMENQYEERNIVGTSNTKQVFSVLRDYTERMTTLCCESLLLLQLKEGASWLS